MFKDVQVEGYDERREDIKGREPPKRRGLVSRIYIYIYIYIYIN